MFKWLINLFSSKSEETVKVVETPIVSDEQAVVVEKPYIAPAPVQAEEAPKPKKKRYYKPKAKKTETPAPAQEKQVAPTRKPKSPR